MKPFTLSRQTPLWIRHRLSSRGSSSPRFRCTATSAAIAAFSTARKLNACWAGNTTRPDHCRLCGSWQDERTIEEGKDAMTNDELRPEDHVQTLSRPSDLKITDLRTATVGWNNWRFTIVRIDTNQGLSGYGEVRDFASKTYALMLKSRIVGENPCNVDKIFRKIKQFGNHGRQGGGVAAVEMALMDLAGKAYGAPAYMLAGGKFRDRIRMYCDTPNEPTGAAMGKKLQERIDRGYTMLKMDVGVQPLIGQKGTLSWPQGMLPGDPVDQVERMLNTQQVMHPFTHVRLTPKGIDSICEYVSQVRE